MKKSAIFFLVFGLLCVISTKGTTALAQTSAIFGVFSTIFNHKPLQDALLRYISHKAMEFAKQKGPEFDAWWRDFFTWKEESVYDVTVNIDSISTLFDHQIGWPIYFKDDESLREHNKNTNDTVVISFMGVYNRGKTHIMNYLSENNCPSGLLVHTAGVNFMYPKIEDSEQRFVFVDTAGTQQPVRRATFKDRLASESFLQDFVLDISDVNVFVVNSLTRADQQYMEEVLQYLRNQRELKGDTRPVGENFIVVHNYKDLISMTDVNKKIEKDIGEDANKKWRPARKQDEKELVHWVEPDTNIRHVVFAREGSEAGNYYNPIAYALFREWFFNSKTDTSRGDTFIQRLRDFAQEKIGNYFDISADEVVESPNIIIASRPPRLTTERGKPYEYKKDLSFDGNIAVSPSKDKFVPKYDIRANKTHLVFLLDVPGVLPGTGSWEDGSSENSLKCIFKTRIQFLCKSEGLSLQFILSSTPTVEGQPPQGPRVAFYGKRRREYASFTKDVRIDRRGYGTFGDRHDWIYLTDNDTFENPQVMWKNGVFQVILEKEVRIEDNDNW